MKSHTFVHPYISRSVPFLYQDTDTDNYETTNFRWARRWGRRIVGAAPLAYLISTMPFAETKAQSRPSVLYDDDPYSPSTRVDRSFPRTSIIHPRTEDCRPGGHGHGFRIHHNVLAVWALLVQDCVDVSFRSKYR